MPSFVTQGGAAAGIAHSCRLDWTVWVVDLLSSGMASLGHLRFQDICFPDKPGCYSIIRLIIFFAISSMLATEGNTWNTKQSLNKDSPLFEYSMAVMFWHEALVTDTGNHLLGERHSRAKSSPNHGCLSSLWGFLLTKKKMLQQPLIATNLPVWHALKTARQNSQMIPSLRVKEAPKNDVLPFLTLCPCQTSPQYWNCRNLFGGIVCGKKMSQWWASLEYSDMYPFWHFPYKSILQLLKWSNTNTKQIPHHMLAF